jgi:cytosine/adenosine deaminase-related metal-dependent hydrolase
MKRITGGIVVTMDAARRVIADGAVVVDGTRIVAVGTAAELARAYPDAEILDATGCAILPGLIDGHAHAGHGLVKTLGNGDSALWSEACRVIYTTASPPAFWRAEARLAALERLSFGVTTGVSLLGGGDSVMRTDAVAAGIAHHEGVAEIGIRDIMAVGPTRPPHPWPYADWNGDARTDKLVSFEQQLETIAALIETCHGQRRGHVATLMPVYRKATHDSAEVAEIERQGRLVRDLGKRHGVLFHQDGHRAGSLAMAETMFGLLGPDAFMSHCTDLTEADIEAVGRTGTAIVHNPSAIASVRGYCPVLTLLARGVTVMLGSDGTAPDRSTDMFRHMFMARRVHQREHRDETLLPPGKVLEMVTVDAAAGLGMSAEIGSLEPGKRADVITVDLRKPHLAPGNMPVWRLVCFANGQDVDTVMVDGEVLMRNRVIAHVDTAEVLAEADRETLAMLRRAGLEQEVVERPGWGKIRI